MIDNSINNLEENTNRNSKEEKLKSINDNNNNIKANYPYVILIKKRDLNNSLRYLFKNRLTKNRINSNTKSNKSLPKLKTLYLFNSKKILIIIVELNLQNLSIIKVIIVIIIQY